MMEQIDLKKLEEAAFSAIDELFSEEPELKDERILRLEEAILSLDWEFTHKDLNNLRLAIQELIETYDDKLNKAILSMMESITKFLIMSKELAPPETLTVLGKIAKIFRELNTLSFPEREKKAKVKEAYALFNRWREEITQIKKTKEEKEKKYEEPPKEIPVPAITERAVVEVKPEVPLDLSEKMVIDEKTFSHLKELVQSLKEDLQAEGKQVAFYFQKLETKISDVLKEIEQIYSRLVIIEDFKLEFDFLKQKLIELENKLKEEKIEVVETKEKASLEEIKKEIEEIEKMSEVKEEEVKEEVIAEEPLEEMWPYVLVFSFGNKLIALPVENIANIYSISPKKAQKLKEKEKIYLKELKSFWHKLRKNMKGNLKNLKEKELEKMEVPVLSLSQSDEGSYNTAVLIESGEKYGVLFLGKIISKNTFLPEKGKKIEENEIEAEVEIPDKGIAYLVNPSYFFET